MLVGLIHAQDADGVRDDAELVKNGVTMIVHGLMILYETQNTPYTLLSSGSFCR